MPKKLKIKNIGPIEFIEIVLNKINVFMGQQSSGKSTIAKIISFCSWIEKDISIHQDFSHYLKDDNFKEKLETFHKMKGYLSIDSEIEYTGDAIRLHFKGDKINIEWVNTRFDYTKCKISYIPSERSMVILPEMEKVEFPNNYLKSFLFDWFDARKNYSKSNKLEILKTGLNFYFSEELKENHISSNKYDILLSQASSGLQAVTPMITMVDNLIHNIYNQDQKASYELDEIKARVTQLIISEFILKPIYGSDFLDQLDLRKEKIIELNQKIANSDEDVLNHFENYKKIRANLFETHRTDLIIEEPEQNLFPSTQKDLIYDLIEKINSQIQHSLSLTTHSPYVLYALNNCILHSIVSNKSEFINNDITCKKAKINPTDISIYEIKNGKIENIQNEMGLIGDNFFDAQMKEVMDDFYVMLNYL